jgi:hypothetical protein
MPYAGVVASEHAQSLIERFQLALDLYDLGERMLRQKLRRQRPPATEAEIDAEIAEWQGHRPGAEHGDSDGVPVAWPRRRG